MMFDVSAVIMLASDVITLLSVVVVVTAKS